ncbi:acyl-CoA dehydrogenase [Microvirga sp. W0021]|uniref:Acyl-CoA dehydrogenase n=1 Tax=Hohaiivirga grylli TaxID=3133970 RepID=A0ABV0BH63_9HYPH
MTFNAPVKDIAFAMNHVAGLKKAIDNGTYAELSDDMVETILEEAGKFANEMVAPLNRDGDTVGAKLIDGQVKTAPGWKDTYNAWTEAGWATLTGSPEYGGQGLPHLLASACYEMWSSASMAWCLGPILTGGGVEALTYHGSQELKDRYLEKLITGEWMATMNLTEPEAGSDLAPMKTRATPKGDGTYLIKGQKIFISYGDHDLTDNIIHLVLARLPDAPAGTRGISLFLVPKFLPDGTRNDAHPTSLEHKMGIHGSPTAVMEFGAGEGAVGWLIGEENRGLACMFTMMNNARLNVGIEGVGIAERAYQQALAYAKERRQARAVGTPKDAPMSAIIEHPDVKRMLLTMKALTQVSRGICYMTSAALDEQHLGADDAAKKAGANRAALLTPIAKAFSTDVGNEVSSLGVQVHGGAGFIEETGAAQHMRDARIAAIYEGTNGIQAIDLVTRKLPLENGEVVFAQIAAIRATAKAVAKAGSEHGETAARLRDAAESLDQATSFLLKAVSADLNTALAVATPYLRLFGLVLGGSILAEMAMASAAALASGETDPAHKGRIALSRFYAENLLLEAASLSALVLNGASSVMNAEEALAD